MKLFQTTASRAADPADFSGGAAALTALERAELQRQGAKAAARGDPADANPMRQHLEAAGSTGTGHSVWALRAAAWQVGYDLQARALREGRTRAIGEPDRDFE